MDYEFDVSAFYGALNAVREARGLAWKQVAAETGVNASTLTRIGQGKKPDVDGLISLLMWSNLTAEMFVQGGTKKRIIEPVAEITRLIRMDRTLSHNNAKIVEDVFKSTYTRLKITEED